MRLFTTIDIPDSWRREAESFQRRLATSFADELRFVRRDELHVTARFIGETAAEPAAALTQAIEALPPFEVQLQLGPAGTFASASRPSVVWLGVAIADRDVALILEAVDGAIRAAGLTPSDQAWRPHLTLARLRRQVGADRRRAVAQAVRELPPPVPNEVVVTRVSLFRSDLGNRAPRHKLLARSAIS